MSERNRIVRYYQTLYNRAVLTGIAVVCVFTLGMIVGMAIR